MCQYTEWDIYLVYIYLVLQAITSESMCRIKNMFRQKFCEFEGDIR